MNDTPTDQPRPKEASVIVLTFGFLLIIEALGIAAISLALIGIGIGILTLLMSGALAWAGSILADLKTGNGKWAAAVVLIVGLGLGYLGHVLMFLGACGVNCPSSMPRHIYTIPVLVILFNLVCAILLLGKGAKPPRGS